MCGIHMGPLVYLNTSSLVNPYIQVSLFNSPFEAADLSNWAASILNRRLLENCLSFR